MGRGYLGKAMVGSIDRFTAVRMYDKVKRYWAEYLKNLKQSLKAAPKEDQEAVRVKIKFMEGTDMAVVISQSQNEVGEFKKRNLEIATHRRRIVNEELDEKFKDPDNPFRIVFFCAMWMTGFDAQNVSTIYLDKPMRNHTLMQTIARANRVFEDKTNGLIVDYAGNLRNLYKALAIYGSGSGGGIKEGEWPVRTKDELRRRPRDATGQALHFCPERNVNLQAIETAHRIERIKTRDDG